VANAKENAMPEQRITSQLPSTRSTTITIVGVENMAPTASWRAPTFNVCSYTVPGESMRPSAPLSEGAARALNTLLTSIVPEGTILRDMSEDF
jgi:hypothetical protein